MELPEQLRYTEQHEWIRMSGDVGTVGITDYAQDALSDIVFVELPSPGRSVSMGEELGTIESSKTVTGWHAPVSGRILEVNSALEDDPGLLNADPYGEGWICRISPSDSTELSRLMSAAEYDHFCGSRE